ncbi:Col_cuticle_N domain-containing protein [Caenorhabditis elegans]|uniref:Col_cuticle_N domain-containing protein n=1 Tax=Caenorhabditis elegans TaxID=6239 RepID=Q19533_CAEEL|nr:Col_cuticle_N domain-containing protein [Caenorhabditis elegans]CAA93651.2 Col_cuticle_N domain-containing protein [Caenorhabditis elegans]
MSPIPPFNTPSPILRSAQSFNIDQINQINAFFSSTAGIVTFSAVWLFCVVALFLVTGWLLTRHEEENRTNPELARETEIQGMMLLSRVPDPSVEIELPTISGNEYPGRYHRFL